MGERRLVYAIVAGGFHLLSVVVAAMTATLVPVWWSAGAAVVWLAIAGVIAVQWKRTGPILALGILGFIAEIAGVAVLLP